MEEEPFNSLYKPALHATQSSSLVDFCLLFHQPFGHSKQLIISCLEFIGLYVPDGHDKHSVNNVLISVNFPVYIPMGQSSHSTAFLIENLPGIHF